ncbi:putative signal transduction protein [uncultured Desulfobacterium sp.]|uniref:histidine kinase n=1 Tax=uncultured Desulfobacterium sp. TaxID=201089 RepID=A0A445MUB5_9BACT|nr:putative signal transduction protein [uncultured Desulfobacterium sp.]
MPNGIRSACNRQPCIVESHRQMQAANPIVNQIATLKHLPSLPHILLKIISACNSDNIDMAEIARILEKDPSLSSKILRMVNSAHYGLPQKMESITQCVAYLGVNTIKTIAIGASISQALYPVQGNGLFNLKRFWRHSLKCAVLARLISKQIRHNNPEEAFLAGLLHDIGRLILWINYPKEYAELLSEYEDRPDLLLAAEIRMGMTHCEVGAWQLDRWSIQSFIVDAVLYHHQPADKVSNASTLVQIISVANALARFNIDDQERVLDLADKLCGINPSQAEEALSRTDEEMGEVARLLGLEIEEPSAREGTASTNDDETQQALVSEVRDVSLLLSAFQNLLDAPDEISVLNVIHQGLEILFDLKDIYIFIYDSEKDCLVGKEVTVNPRSSLIADFMVLVRSGQNLLASALRQAKPLHLAADATDYDTAIIDMQLLRFVGKDGIMAVPMLARGQFVGVIVMGLDQFEFSQLSEHINLLNMFARQAALSIHADQIRRSSLTMVRTERAGVSSDIARKVVHEVNNPLTIIKNYLKILGIKLNKQNIAQDEISIINKEIDRIGRILGVLSSFSRNEKLKAESVDVNAVLSDLIKITRESLQEHSKINIHMDLSSSLPNISSDEDRMKQIFVNLVKNASEAMSGGGNLYIKTRLISGRLDGDVTQGNGARLGYIEVTISDDGPGIPDEIKSRIFDPFVSSKGGGHSGLGLSIVNNIVRSMNGTITCESEGGKGAAFIVALPIINKNKS